MKNMGRQYTILDTAVYFSAWAAAILDIPTVLPSLPSLTAIPVLSSPLRVRYKFKALVVETAAKLTDYFKKLDFMQFLRILKSNELDFLRPKTSPTEHPIAIK